MHSIVTMMEKVRSKRGSFGLVTANGWYVTKHSLGIYSTTPTKGDWKREDPKVYQAEIDAMDRPLVEAQPNGEATIETYTVMHDRSGPKIGIIVGRLANGHRFLAHSPSDPATLADLMERECLGRKGTATAGSPTNTFVPH
jgi:acetyl-CoA C-acetyltransferase